MIENLNFGKTGFNSCVFEKHCISYSCILFLKFNALRSFCIKLLCFSKLWFFQNFDPSNLFFDRSKLWLKFWSGSVCFDWCSIANGSIEALSIDWIYFSINRKSRWEFFLKTFVFTCFTLFQTFSKHFSLSFDRSRLPKQFFVVFSKIFARFFSSKAGKTFLPFFLHLFSCFMH